MKRPNREITIFNLSMLDVMTGALGAVMIVMIVLLTQKIGMEAMSCQDIKSELVSTSDQLAETTNELSKTKIELQNYKKENPAAIEKVTALTKLMDSTADKFNNSISKISQLKKELFDSSQMDDELVAFKLPHKVVMVVDLSGSMSAKNNKYGENRLSQVKAALKMFIAAMDQNYKIDIVFFPAFKENINSDICSDFKIKPALDNKCKEFDLRDEAYDSQNLICYKYGYLEGKLKGIQTDNDKYDFYKKIECLQPYHDTPTGSALEFILTKNTYKDAEGIILFSDGQPDSIRKKHATKDSLLASIKKMNNSNKKIFTVGIGREFRNQENSEAVDFLKKLAEQNKGFYIGF